MNIMDNNFKPKNFKLFIVCALAVMTKLTNAGGIIAQAPLAYSFSTPTITSQSANILRSPGNLAQVSTYSKTIDTPFSSSSKSDIRVSNPGVYQTLSYAAPAAPALAYAAAPAAPALAYAAAPAYASHALAAPAYASHALAAPAYASHALAAPAAPALAYSSGPALAAAPAVAYAGHAYAAAPAVAHTTFSGLGYSYHF